MGKRSNFERNPRDYYVTPKSAVEPLIPILRGMGIKTFVEPCAGNGKLIKHLEEENFKCVGSCDIEPQENSYDIKQHDALTLEFDNKVSDCIITNPPWDRKILHPMIEHFSNQLPTWLLFDADWMHTKQSKLYIDRCRKIVSVGRAKWIEGSKQTGKDNCCWYLFDKPSSTNRTIFIGR